MKAIEEIREYIKDIEEGESFTTRSLHHLASTDNVRQILTRMVKAGEIKRMARGVYVKPKHSPRLGITFPSVRNIAKLIADKTGETIGIHGAEAARQLQLTTQVPIRLVFYTTGYTRDVKIKNQTILLKHVNPSKLIAPGTIAGIVISALLYLGSKQVSEKTVQKIKNQLKPEEFETVLKEIKHMPAWMANVFYHFRKKGIHG
jgi:hypothetical protein